MMMIAIVVLGDARASAAAASTLGRFIGVRDNFHLNFICRCLFVFTRSGTALTIILLCQFQMKLGKKMLRGCLFYGAKFFECHFMFFWRLLIPQRRKDPVCWSPSPSLSFSSTLPLTVSPSLSPSNPLCHLFPVSFFCSAAQIRTDDSGRQIGECNNNALEHLFTFWRPDFTNSIDEHLCKVCSEIWT